MIKNTIFGNKLALAAVAAMSILPLTAAQAQRAPNRAEVRQDRAEIRRDRQELQRDRQELRQDRRDNRQDRREDRRDDRRDDGWHGTNPNRNNGYNGNNWRYNNDNRSWNDSGRYNNNGRYNNGGYNNSNNPNGWTIWRGTVTEDLSGNGFRLRTDNGSAIRVVLTSRSKGEPGGLSRGDFVQVAGQYRNGIFYCDDLNLINNR